MVIASIHQVCRGSPLLLEIVLSLQLMTIPPLSCCCCPDMTPQPRSAIWALFHKVTLLSRGRLLFFGPREGMVPWLAQSFQGARYCPEEHG